MQHNLLMVALAEASKVTSPVSARVEVIIVAVLICGLIFELIRRQRMMERYAILWLVERARALHLPYVYLGYWVPESRKMAYKARFRPSEILAGGTWRMLTDADLGSTECKTGTLLVPETADLG